MKQCDNGHFYDDNRFGSCPYCREGAGQSRQAAVTFQSQPVPSFQQNASQIPLQQQFKFCTRCGNKVEAASKFCTSCGNPLAAPVSPTSDIGKTVAVAPVTPSYSTSDIGKTVAVSSAFSAPTSDIGKTVAVNPAFNANPTTEDLERTLSVRKPAAAPVQTPTADIGRTVGGAAVQPAPVSAPAPTSDIGKTVAMKPLDNIPFASSAPAAAPVQTPTADIGRTVGGAAVQPAPVSAPAPTSDIGKTVAMKPLDNIPFASPAPAAAPVQAPTADIGRTVGGAAVQPAPAPVQAPTADIGKTEAGASVQAAPEAKPEMAGPAAFLVCIAGANRGDYYAVSGGRNCIASGADADIRLDKDPAVSADCHAVITYNPMNNQFTLSAGTGHGITYLNGNQIDVSADIKADDRIRLGSSELLFVPVCSDKFKWDAQA
ncbi:MAG: FHA domain-containing protein [Clostridiales bacterium]|nr:FHA domain-containing protein [Clostridiales bacterium]